MLGRAVDLERACGKPQEAFGRSADSGHGAVRETFAKSESFGRTREGFITHSLAHHSYEKLA